MTMSEHDRLTLYRSLGGAIGEGPAAMLMGALPMVAADELVTKTYLNERLESLENKLLATIRGEMVSQTRTIVFAMIGTMFTAISLAMAGAAFVR